MHRDGDTMLTFAEVNPPVTNPTPTLSDLQTAQSAMDSPNEVRYRIYRSSSPIDAVTVRTAELVDEIKPMSGWNWTITTTNVIPTLPVDDMTASAVGTGIYVRRAKAGQSAYYAVSRAVNGEEDLSLWVPNQNSLAASVAESIGTGMVLKYKQVGLCGMAVRQQRDAELLHPLGVPAHVEHAELRPQLPGGRPADDRVAAAGQCRPALLGRRHGRLLGLVVRGRPRLPAGHDEPDPLRLVDRLTTRTAARSSPGPTWKAMPAG